MSPEWLPRREFENYRRDVIDPMRDQLKGVASKEDLNEQTVILTRQINGVIESRNSTFKWWMGGLAALGVALIMLVVQIAAKALKLL